MKKLLPLSIILGLLITSVSSFSFVGAQFVQTARGTVTAEKYCKTSTVCGTAPEKFTMILDFVTEMMNSIKTIGTEGDYVGKYVNPNRFIGNDFNPPAKTVVGKLAKNIEQKAKFGLASTAIFSSPVNFAGLKDVLGGTVLLSKNKVFLRDAKIVETLESQVSDKRYELGLGGGRYEKIIPQNIAIMNSIIQKYVDKGLLLNGSATDGVLYNNVTSLLLRTLSAAKSVLYFDSVSQFTEFSRGGDNGIKITFNSKATKSIQDDYDCARGFIDVCDKNKATFTAIRKKITTSLSSSSYNNKKVFSDALTRLGQLFSKNKQKDDPSYQARKDELLRSMYGATKNDRGVFAGSIKKSLSGVLSDITTLGSDVSRFRNPPKNVQDVKNDIVANKANQNILATTTPAQGADTFKEYLKSDLQDVFDQQSTDISLVSFSEAKDVTPTFNSLGNQIYAIKKNVLGSKEKDGSLIQSLGNACEAQCGLGGRGCR